MRLVYEIMKEIGGGMTYNVFIYLIGMFSRKILYNIRNSSMQGEFMTFQEFKENLGSWQEALKGFTDSKIYQDIYTFVKK